MQSNLPRATQLLRSGDGIEAENSPAQTYAAWPVCTRAQQASVW